MLSVIYEPFLNARERLLWNGLSTWWYHSNSKETEDRPFQLLISFVRSLRSSCWTYWWARRSRWLRRTPTVTVTRTACWASGLTPPRNTRLRWAGQCSCLAVWKCLGLRTIMLQTSNESSVEEVSLEDGPARLPDLPRPQNKKHSSFRSRLSFRKKETGPGSPSALRRRSTTVQTRGRAVGGAVGGAERRDSSGWAAAPTSQHSDCVAGQQTSPPGSYRPQPLSQPRSALSGTKNLNCKYICSNYIWPFSKLYYTVLSTGFIKCHSDQIWFISLCFYKNFQSIFHFYQMVYSSNVPVKRIVKSFISHLFERSHIF